MSEEWCPPSACNGKEEEEKKTTLTTKFPDVEIIYSKTDGAGPEVCTDMEEPTADTANV